MASAFLLFLHVPWPSATFHCQAGAGQVFPTPGAGLLSLARKAGGIRELRGIVGGPLLFAHSAFVLFDSPTLPPTNIALIRGFL